MGRETRAAVRAARRRGRTDAGMTAVADVLDRVRKLLAMAASPHPEEARTAAKMAADLIGKHGVVLSLPEDKDAARSDGGRGPAWWDRFRYDPSHKPPPPPPPKRDPKDERPVEIDARYPGFCRACKREFDAGARVLWRAGAGTTHAVGSCAAYWDRAR